MMTRVLLGADLGVSRETWQEEQERCHGKNAKATMAFECITMDLGFSYPHFQTKGHGLGSFSRFLTETSDLQRLFP